MAKKKISPYGSWSSPITTELVSTNALRIEEIKSDEGSIYWLEIHANQSGRQTIVCCSPDGSIHEITPPGFNVRNKVHEYGGASYQVAHGMVYFCNYEDQRIYSHLPGNDPFPLTPESQDRYADLILDPRHQRLICIRQQHSGKDQEVINSLVAVPLDGGSEISTLRSGNDFYSNPRLSPDGSRLAWLTWDHPNMPWDGCELWVGSLDNTGNITQPRLLAGGPGESIFQPEWSEDGDLFYISDQSGWWRPYRWKNGKGESLCDIEAEFGLPQWVFGLSTYGFHANKQLICTYTRAGQKFLASLDPGSGKITNFQTPYVEYSYLCVDQGILYFVGSSPDRPAELACLDLGSRSLKVLRQTGVNRMDKGFISKPTQIEFVSDNNQSAYGNYYAPVNKNHIPPDGEKPPLIVMLHGGPTAAASLALNLKIQFWTSRGFAVLDVNYSGSTGYGRPYRLRLNGNWGVIDVKDCLQGAQFLASQGLVDGNRMSITGGSAGGYTALCALTFHNIFSAGVSRYGIGSLESLAKDTHKFEAHYLDNLVGPYPEAKEVYRQRSPIHFIEQINAPILLMQGSEDQVVPPIQSERMFNALDAKGLPVAYITFAGEQHGFRRSESIIRALEIELYFYSRIFGFEPDDALEPILIKNL